MRRGQSAAEGDRSGQRQGERAFFYLFHLIFLLTYPVFRTFFPPPPSDLQPDAEMILINIITLAFVLGE